MAALLGPGVPCEQKIFLNSPPMSGCLVVTPFTDISSVFGDSGAILQCHHESRCLYHLPRGFASFRFLLETASVALLHSFVAEAPGLYWCGHGSFDSLLSVSLVGLF